MITIEKIREALDRLPSIISGGPGTRGPWQYWRRQDVLSMLDELGEEIPCPYCEEIPCPYCEGVAAPIIKAEINRSCTPAQVKAIRELFERGPYGWVEGVDFIDHTRGGTLCYSKEEMEAFKEMLKRSVVSGPNLERLQQMAEEIYVEQFSGGVAIKDQKILAQACARDMAKAYVEALTRGLEAFREAPGEPSMMGSLAGQRGVPEHVDLAKLYEAQKIIRDTPQYFCDQCGATNPKHGFYPLHHSHVAYNGELMGSVSSVTCNCCHATEKYPCPYCEEEK